MKTKEARQHIEDYRNDDGSLDEAGIADLLTWAYDKGWTEALEDLAKENELLSKLKNATLKTDLLNKECIRRFPEEFELLKGK